MNAGIVRLFAVVLVLFTLLVGVTSYRTVFGAGELRDSRLNRRDELAELRIERGPIRARDGSLIARSVRQRDRTFRRRYPEGSLFGHPIGYAFQQFESSGLERFRGPALTGEREEVSRVVAELTGQDRRGDTVITTLLPRLQRVAAEALQGERGAVVALEPRTGRVLASVSSPGYDPNQVPDDFRALNRDERGTPLLNRVTQSQYIPGSTFKVVTAVAALDSGRYTPDSQVSGENGKVVSGTPLNNFGGQDFGLVDLRTALAQSINTVWAEVAAEIGGETMDRYMRRFGFYREPPVDLPPRELAVSGARVEGRLVDAGDDRVDIGRLGIGQGVLQVTPLQMAMVAAAVANDGTLMEPTLTERIVDPDGRVREDFDEDEVRRVMSQETADAVASMMEGCVQQGSCRSGAVPGVRSGGKTGTAETTDDGRATNQVWYIGFAPLDDPRVAVAVTVEDKPQDTGGGIAAPIASRVMQEALR